MNGYALDANIGLVRQPGWLPNKSRKTLRVLLPSAEVVRKLKFPNNSIISFYIKERPVVVSNLKKARDNRWRVWIPPFAYYEVKRGLMFIHATKRLCQLEALCLQCPVGETDRAVLEAAMEIYVGVRRKGWTIDEMDIFIAAWCKANDFTLVTNNLSHFTQIPGLRLEDWSV